MCEKKRFLGLKKFRERMRIKQNQLAEKLNIGAVACNHYEVGRSDASFEIYRKLFEMGATVEELFEVEYNEMHCLGAREALTASSGGDTDKMQQQMLQVLKKLATVEGELNRLKKLESMPQEPHIEALEARMDKLEGIKKNQKDTSHAQAG
jgi:DNA-binding XRE family transcriptional regulator